MTPGRKGRTRAGHRQSWRVVRGSIPLLPFLAAATTLLAAEQRDLTEMTLEELARTKVTSVSRMEEPRFQTPAAVSVVTAEDIRRSGVTTLPDALRLVPGVHVARITSNQWAIGIRGFTSRLARSQLALMDGRSLYNPLFAGTYWEVQDTILDDVDRIEVVRGPGGTLWGANAVSGIVNVITKSARETQGWLVSGGGGSEERAFVRARYGGSVGEKGHYRVYGKYFRRDGGFQSTGPEFDDWHLAQGGFRSDWKLPGNDSLTVQGDAYGGKAGQRTSLSFYEPPFVRLVFEDSELSGGNLTARWSRAGGGSQTSILAYYDRTRRAEPSFREVRDTINVDLQRQMGIGDRQRLVTGLAYRLSSGKGQGIETVAFIPPDRTDHIFSAFVQDEIDLARDRWHLGVGAKVERNQYTGFELQPSARILWTPRPRQAAWVAVTHAVRTPSRIERDLALTVALSPTAPLFARLIGDGGFSSEKVTAFEAGYRVRPTDRVTLDFAAFHDRHDDLLSIETAPLYREQGRQILLFNFRNLLRGRSSGLELSSGFQASPHWVIRAQYAYLSLELDKDAASTDTSSVAAEGASPRHNSLVQSSWNLPGKIDLDVGFRWVDRLRSQSVPAYSSLDARLGWKVLPGLELSIVGHDLLHAHHPEFGAPAGRTDVERSVFGEATCRW